MFKIETDGVGDFIRFIKFLRNEDIDIEKIKSFTDTLNKDSDKLIEAENKQEGKENA